VINMKPHNRARAFCVALLGIATPLAAQHPDPLAPLVQEAIRNNLQLSASRLTDERAEAETRRARGLYLPTLALESRRSQLDGVVDVGSLINPAYAALNRITGTSAFPTDIRQTLPQPQETHLRLAQPVFNPAIRASHQAARAQQGAQLSLTRAAARDVAAGAQRAYLAYASAVRVVDLDRSVLALTDEMLRAAERRVALGLITPDAVLRARADRAEADQALAEATERVATAARSLNLVLGRQIEREAPSVVDDSLVVPALDSSPDAYVRLALARREELDQLTWSERAAQAGVRAARAAFLPTAAIALDYGTQGRDYHFGADRDFMVASAVLQWNLFNGGQDAARREQAQLDVERVRVQRADLERHIELQVRTAWGAARVARIAVASAVERESAARRNWELVHRRGEQGTASALDVLDARTTWTRSALNLILTRYGYATRWVDLERAAALRTDLDR
jgi:outer membrane protein TolC